MKFELKVLGFPGDQGLWLETRAPLGAVEKAAGNERCPAVREDIFESRDPMGQRRAGRHPKPDAGKPDDLEFFF